MTSRSLHVVTFGSVKRSLVLAVGATLLLAAKGWGDSVTTVSRIQAGGRGTLYIGNRAPLQPSPLMRLPPGSIQPEGWLLTMLQTQRSGLNGRLEEISPWLKFETSDWTMPDGSGATQGWERVPYWLRGYTDLGYCLQEPAVISNATRWLQGVMISQRANGYFGPASTYSETTPDLWPGMPMLDALRSYYEYSGHIDVLNLIRDLAGIASAAPLRFTSIGSSQSGFVLIGSGGMAGLGYYVLSSTNLEQPGSSWTPVATNIFDADGSFTITSPVDSLSAQRYFRIQLPQP